ncbi:hypothetical protein EI94DRAFT_1745713 [Lactarius quietus]|nr:hypothetical protein EI94DRAFT_1745713 [Lactarius quietus]
MKWSAFNARNFARCDGFLSCTGRSRLSHLLACLVALAPKIVPERVIYDGGHESCGLGLSASKNSMRPSRGFATCQRRHVATTAATVVTLSSLIITFTVGVILLGYSSPLSHCSPFCDRGHFVTVIIVVIAAVVLLLVSRL